MRTLLWILGTLLGRSWLIVIGVALGLLARQYFPPTATLGEPEIFSPDAKAYYDSVQELANPRARSQTETRLPQ
ncbi:MAG: hypothetical protein JNK57_17960 [Planctomycetaceae bacterium]|nr:hypothetical protein [Planctomycetaceae bacterium]